MDFSNYLPAVLSSVSRWLFPSSIIEDYFEPHQGGRRGSDSTTSRTVADIVEVRSILTSMRLPVEVADMILDDAEYWAVERFSRSVGTRVSASWMPGSANSFLYLDTDPLAMSPDLAICNRLHCRKVVFSMRSRDQGWGGDPGCGGTYMSAFSWFEASIVRSRDGQEAQRRKSWWGPKRPFDALAEDELPHGFVRRPEDAVPLLERAGWSFVRRGDDVSWLLQRNLCASRSEKDHFVEWREYLDSDDDGTKGDDSDDWPEDGAGKGREFVKSIERGDRIGVWARVMYPGWENNVSKVSVDVYFAV